MFTAVIFQFMQRMLRLKIMRVSPLTKKTAGETTMKTRMKTKVRVPLLLRAIKFFAHLAFLKICLFWGFGGSVLFLGFLEFG